MSPQPLQNRNILLGVTGSVAAIRVPRLICALRAAGGTVQVVCTRAAQHFLNAEEPMPRDVLIHTDEAEWRNWRALSDPVLHIELRRWADAYVMAPLSANSLAKLAGGLCDNLVTCVARAWRVEVAGPFVLAPAMNSEMWAHSVTEEQLKTLQGWGLRFVGPVEKRLACGDVGVGGMAAVQDVVDAVVQAMAEWQPTGG